MQYARAVKHPWRNIMRPAYRPELTMAIMIPFFQQVTGVPSTRSCGPLSHTPVCSWRRIAKDTFHHSFAPGP